MNNNKITIGRSLTLQYRYSIRVISFFIIERFEGKRLKGKDMWLCEPDIILNRSLKDICLRLIIIK
jgi:hypothetical protein